VIEINPNRPPSSKVATSPSTQSVDERVVLLELVLASRTFAKSSRLAQFLKYICTQTIAGNAKEINEQQIGIHVFARSPAYSSSDDSIVRTQARLLRQRLEEYFEHEAPSSKLIITIPKGGYVPLFELSTNHSAPPAELASQVPEETAALPNPISQEDGKKPIVQFGRKNLRLLFIAVASLLAVAAAVGITILRTKTSTASDILWARIFKEGRPVVIVPSDDGLVLFEEQAKEPVPLDQYLSGSYLDKESSSDPRKSILTSEWLAAHQYTSTADLNLALRLGRLPAARDAVVETRNARVVRIDDLKSRNVILIGGMGANPWISLFSNHLNFEVNYDWKNGEGYVLNKHPAHGEAPIYHDKVVDGIRHSYGVLAFLPGIEDEGEALLFEGTGMAGTESASDFPFNAAAFGAFAQQIGRDKKAMPYFEALIETTSVGGNAPEVHVLTYHKIQ